MHLFLHAFQQKYTLFLYRQVFLLFDRYQAIRCTNLFSISTNCRIVSYLRLNARNHIKNAKCACASPLLFTWLFQATTTNHIHFGHDQTLRNVSRKSRSNFLRLRSCLPWNLKIKRFIASM